MPLRSQPGQKPRRRRADLTSLPPGIGIQLGPPTSCAAIQDRLHREKSLALYHRGKLIGGRHE
jgi:hypothetical protein